MSTEFMTVQEIAEYLRLGKQKVYRLSQTGVLPAYKFGSEWRYKKERIDQWIEEQDTYRKKKQIQEI